MSSLKALLFASLWLGRFALAAGEPATVMVAGHPLFTIQARVGSVEPVERVRLINSRMERLSKDLVFPLDTITVRDAGEIGWEVVAGNTLLLVVTSADAKRENRSAKAVAESIALRLREALAEDRRAKSPREVLIRSLYALGYLLGLALVLWAMARLHRRWQARLQAERGGKIRPVRIKTFEVFSSERVVFFASGLLRALRLSLTLILLYFSIPVVLSLFPWTEKLSPILLGYVLNPLHQMGKSLLAFIPNLFIIVLNVVVARYVLKVTRLFFDEIEKGNLRFNGFYPEWAYPTYQLVRILAIAFTVVIVFPYIPGSSSPAFQGVSVFLGVLVSLGSTSAVGNAVAGIVITYMRSFRPGDRVKIAETTGDIVEKALFVTRLRTIKNVDITIPNSLVLASHIVNYSALAPQDGLILNTEVTIGYDAPWRKVHELLIEAAKKTEGILSLPEPFVLQTSLDDSYVRYQLNAYTRRAHDMASLYSALHGNIQDCFNDGGVEIMSPAYSAIRDGNTVTIPADKRPAGYSSPSFRVRNASPLEGERGAVDKINADHAEA